jgi:lactate dehydrogenase-like 2-hydroxyacid dehydrogenase
LLRRELPEDEVLECSPQEISDIARDVEVLVPLVAHVGDGALASPRLRLVQQFGAGLDGVDVVAASRHGVYVANVPSGETANADSVAELAILLMLALARRLPGDVLRNCVNASSIDPAALRRKADGTRLAHGAAKT